jgi:hypothetical protein
MNKIRTMQEILEDRMIERTKLAGNPQAMFEEANKQLIAVSKRLDADPALGKFAEMWMEAMSTVIRMNPPEAHAFVLRQVIAQLVMDWDSIKEAYDDQFTSQ